MVPQKARVGPIALLILLVLIWAISWPVIKIGVGQVPPLWYGCLRYAIGALSLFAFGGIRRSLPLPPRADWQLIAVSGVLQMAAYSALTGIALTTLPPGRASVLAFSTPIWVAPLAAWRLGERR
jgi:O-acetylserine/cysteine efflux transporter